MAAILLIVVVSMVVFVALAVAMKKTDPPETQSAPPMTVRTCGICGEDFAESDLVERVVGEAGYKRWFCDACVVDLYQESREMHDPRSKDSTIPGAIS